MSTESTALFSTPKKTAHPKKVSSGLCISLLPTGLEREVFTKEIPGQPLRITVRPFCVATDVPMLFKWLSQEYAGPLLSMTQPPYELEESYASMVESDFAQPFIGLVNDIPVCQMDIYKTQQGAISLSYPARTGDYGLQLVVAPLAVQDNMVHLIGACLEHFFSFPEVGRIIVDVDAGSEYNKGLFRKAGFRSLYDIRTSYRSSSLYVLTAQQFRQGLAASPLKR
jgi:hypothetical protein